MLLIDKNECIELLYLLASFSRGFSKSIYPCSTSILEILDLKMGCSASKSNVVEVQMPKKVQQNLESKEKKIEREDSLRGSKASLTSGSDVSRSDRETSAKSTRTTDSGVGELEDDNIITEHSSPEKMKEAKVDERPETPADLSIDGTSLARRKKSPKERKEVSFTKEINNNNGISIMERPQSRGGMAFDVEFYPDTGNVKRRPIKLKSLEKKKPRTKRRTKEEIKDKLEEAKERRQEYKNHIAEKAALSRKERQLREAKALDEFAQRQTRLQESQEQES